MISDTDYERAINSIVQRREAMIMEWAANPGAYTPIVHGGVLDKIKSDLKELRRLQARLKEEGEPLTDGGIKADIMVRDLRGDQRSLPDWLLEHQND